MKKYPIFLAVIISAVISCSQEEVLKTDEVKLVPVTIVAESSGFATKTTATLNDTLYNIKWEKGDELSVFAVVDTENGPKIDPANRKFIAQQTADLATFTGVLPEGVKSIYPIMPFDEDANINDGLDVYTSIPAEQNGDFYNVVLAGCPRPDTKAETEDFLYEFEAVSGILKFSFDPEKIAPCEGNTQHIVQISITADRPIAGDAKISFADGKPVMTANPNKTASNQYNTITLLASDHENGFSKGDYYIATLPINKRDAIDTLGFSVKLVTKEGEVAYINAKIGGPNKKHILTANVVKNIGTVKTTNYVPHFTSGEFTVDNQGTKVSFSPGNLQYQASSNTWRFALNQWDAQGELGNATPHNNTSGNEGARATQSEWIDLFPWGHTGFTDKSRTYYPYSSYNAEGNYCGYVHKGVMKDDYNWGSYCDIVNGNHTDTKGTWRLLTQNEWNYLLSLDAADPGSKTYSYGRCAKVNTDAGKEGTSTERRLFFMKIGVKTGVFVETKEIIRMGLLLFPDGFTWPAALADKKPNVGCYSKKEVFFSDDPKDLPSSDYYLAPQYSLTDFAILEQAGCVFLPASSKRSPTLTISDFNRGAYYWTTNQANGQHLDVYLGSLSFGGANFTQARSVRLVKNVPAATAEHEGVESDGDYNF